jgi:hypothetical protein
MIKAIFSLVLVVMLSVANLWVAANFGFTAGLVTLGLITSANLVGQLVNKK